MLVTKALLLPLRFRTDNLSQDVTYLSFVPLAQEVARRLPIGSFVLAKAKRQRQSSLEPKSLHFDVIFTKIHLTILIFYLPISEFFEQRYKWRILHAHM